MSEPEQAGAGPASPEGGAVVDVLDLAGLAALSLAEDRPWSDISLRDIAQAAGLSFAELYARSPGKSALVERMSRRFDRLALVSVEQDLSSDPVDRLFEAVMARLEAMASHRSALIAIASADGRLSLAPQLARTARAMLEAAGIDTSGRRGAMRLVAMTAVWARVLQVWRDDEGALNRTMAEIDKRLKQMQSRLSRVGAGF